MDKMNMTGTKAQLYNGFLLLGTFFCCRLLYGTWQSYSVFRDYWALVDRTPNLPTRALATMGYSTPQTTVPLWLAVSYLGSNLVLNFLNFYWFFMMIKAVRKRFVPRGKEVPAAPKAIAEVEVDLSPVVSGLEKVAAPGAPSGRKRRA